MNIFSHKHKVEWENLWAGPTQTVYVARCHCGYEARELTGAGIQQVGWWIDLGLTPEEATQGVMFNTLPHPIVWDEILRGWHIYDTREIALNATIDPHNGIPTPGLFKGGT